MCLDCRRGGGARASERYGKARRGATVAKEAKEKGVVTKEVLTIRVPVVKVLCPRRQHSAHIVEHRERGSQHPYPNIKSVWLAVTLFTREFTYCTCDRLGLSLRGH